MKLFEEFKSEKLSLKNRIVMAPMTRSMSPNNIPTDEVCEYYRLRAAGGVGLIITEGVNISVTSSAGYPDVPVMYGEALDSWRNIVKAVHDEGGKIAPQLWHVGAIRSPKFDIDNQVESMSPSGINYLNKTAQHQTREMSKKEIEDVISSFVEAAGNAKKVGFDAIELHGAHGYLIDQFFWHETNKRTDKYGGDTLVKRTKFACEIIKRIKQELGEDFPIIFRFSNWKLGVYEDCLFNTPNELEDFLRPLKEAGVDIFHASSRDFDKPEFTGSHLNLAGWTKKFTDLPVISVGSVGLEKSFTDTFQSETSSKGLAPLSKRLEASEFDLIAVGRALISDSEWPIKIESGRENEIKNFVKDDLNKL